MRRITLVTALMGLLIAACGGGEADVQAAADACEAGEVDGDLNLYNWTEYIPYGSIAEDNEVDDLLAAFEEEHGVEVVLTEYESNEAMLAQVEAGGAPYDLVVPSDYMVSLMSGSDLLVRLNKDAIPNLANIDPRFTGLPFDPNGDFSVPYQWGTTGIGFSYEVVDDTEGISWGLLFDAEQRADYAGSISMLDDSREALGAALKYLGYSLNSTSQDELDEAAALIRETKEDIATFSSAGYEDLLVEGTVMVAQGWNGDFFLAFDNASTDDYDAYEDFGYAVPDEGGVVWVDNVAIPTTAESPCTAHAFIDFLLDAQNGATLTNYNYYASPNAAAEEFIYPEILEDPAIYPPQELFDDGSLEFLEDLGEFSTNYEDAFVEAKS
ncbi:MAG TPA: spermidine/putrescine ABC transporter substrate-binding protein [Acidimicrobiia bacterium]|nr:spermidine/putrescine ABC transporter substrate-binding protein [Acidimicrobiia bacterium]